MSKKIKLFNNRDFLIFFEKKKNKYLKKKITFKDFNHLANNIIFKINKFVDEKDFIIISDNNFNFSITFLSLIMCSRKILILNKSAPPNLKRKIIFNSGIKNIIIFNKADIEKEIINQNEIKNFKIFNSKDLFRKIIPHNKKINFQINSDLEIIFSSSGTTQIPKLISLNKTNLLSQIKQINSRFDISSFKVLMTPMPVNHIGAMGYVLLNGLFYSKKIVFLNFFNTRKFFEILNNYKPNFLYLNPTIINLLNLINIKDRSRKKSKIIVFCGSAPLHKSTLKDFINKYKNFKFIHVYGLTETTNTIMTNLKNLKRYDYDHLYFKEKTPSVGTPLTGVQIKILNKNNKIINKENIIGEILAKGPNVIKFYVDEGYDKTKFFKGYLKTGDIGYYKYYKKRKYFYLLGRNDDIIQVDGFNVSLNEIDSYLVEKKILNTITLAVDDKFHGKILILATIDKSVYRRNLSFLNEKRPHYMKLNKIYFFNQFFKTNSGKYQKNKMIKFIEKNNLQYKVL